MLYLLSYLSRPGKTPLAKEGVLINPWRMLYLPGRRISSDCGEFFLIHWGKPDAVLRTGGTLLPVCYPGGDRNEFQERGPDQRRTIDTRIFSPVLHLLGDQHVTLAQVSLNSVGGPAQAAFRRNCRIRSNSSCELKCTITLPASFPFIFNSTFVPSRSRSCCCSDRI